MEEHHPPDIGLLENAPELTEVLDNFYGEIYSDTLVIKREQRGDPLVYAAIELSDLPTAIVIAVFSTYFSTLAKNAAETHYPKLEGALIRLTEKLFHKEKDVVVVQSKKIERDRSEYSTLFSILTNADKCRVKFVFRTECSKSEYVATARAILDFLSAYHGGENSSDYPDIVDAIQSRSRVVIAYDGDSEALYVV